MPWSEVSSLDQKQCSPPSGVCWDSMNSIHGQLIISGGFEDPIGLRARRYSRLSRTSATPQWHTDVLEAQLPEGNRSGRVPCLQSR